MNTIAKAILISAAISLPAISGIAYGHEKGDAKSGSMMNNKMMGEQMMNMRAQMQQNHDLMESIINENNAGKRDQLMQQHMDSMQSQMHGMNKVMGDELVGGTSSEDMAGRMEMMNMRMNMMQMMMEQMMEHQDQVE